MLGVPSRINPRAWGSFVAPAGCQCRWTEHHCEGCAPAVLRGSRVCGVRTYIQSGNILFRPDGTDLKELTGAVERALSERLSYEARAVVLTHRKYKSAVGSAPDGRGETESQRHNALFTFAGITSKRVLTQLPPPRADVDTVTAGPGVIFWSVSKEQQARSAPMRLPASAGSSQRICEQSS